jgi:hypothetical protein
MPDKMVEWAHLSTPGKADVQFSPAYSVSFGTVSPARTSANEYAEFTFPYSGNLDPGSWIQFAWQLNSPNPSAMQYTQTGAWSFNSSDTSMNGTSWNHVVVLVNGSIAWGTPPM